MRRLLLLSAALLGFAPRAHAGGTDDRGDVAGRPARPLSGPCEPSAPVRPWRASSPGDAAAPDAGETESGRVATPEVAAEDEAVAATVAFTVLTTNRYLYRGFLVEDEGAIVQAWVDVQVPIFVGQGFLKQLDVGAVAWTSFGTGPTGTGGDTQAPRAFSEVDWTLSATATLAGGFTVGASYVWFRYPNDSAAPLDEVAVSLGYDDGPLWPEAGRFRGFSPTAIVAHETRGQSDDGRHQGTYLGLGVAPRLSLTTDPEGASLAFPITAGFSLSGYYEDDAGQDELFGFVEMGPELSLPLGSAGGASFSVTLGVHLLLAGDYLRRVNDTDEPEIVAFLAFETSF